MYIAGKITGDDDYKSKFAGAEQMLHLYSDGIKKSRGRYSSAFMVNMQNH